MNRLAIVILGLTVVTCGGDVAVSTTSGSTTTTGVERTSTTTPAATSSTGRPQTTTTTTVAAPAPDLTITGGTTEKPGIVVAGPALFSFVLGDTVLIRIASSLDAELHVHGYDLYFDLVAGSVTQVSFDADIPGIFEVELEETHTAVFDLEVTP